MATGLGLGALRPGPGTWGSLGAVLVLIPLAVGLPSDLLPFACAALALLASLACLLCTGPTSRWLGQKDPGAVVIDEIAGVWAGAALLSGTILATQWWWLLPALFAAFRVLDIGKPWPIRALERLPGAWGVLLDDLAAGLAAGGALRLIACLS